MRRKRLTYLEKQTLKHVLSGKTNKEIAEEMASNEDSVKNSIRRALAKLGLRNCRQIIPRASEISQIISIVP